MPVWIAFLRGVNVGGANKLPMAKLKEAGALAGFPGMATYIQSGNCVFAADDADASSVAARLHKAITETTGIDCPVMALRPADLAHAESANPFAAIADEPSRMHLAFLAREPDAPDTGRLDRLKTGTEQWALAGRVFYLHAPDGIGRSKLAAGFEKSLGVPATARNLATVRKMREIAASEAFS